MRPPGALPLSSSQVRALLALVDVHSQEGRATVRRVAFASGSSVMATHKRLAVLRDAGLVDWLPVANGTLHPLVARVR